MSAKYDITHFLLVQYLQFLAVFHGSGFSGSDPDFLPNRIRTQEEKSPIRIQNTDLYSFAFGKPCRPSGFPKSLDLRRELNFSDIKVGDFRPKRFILSSDTVMNYKFRACWFGLVWGSQKK